MKAYTFIFELEFIKHEATCSEITKGNHRQFHITPFDDSLANLFGTQIFILYPFLVSNFHIPLLKLGICM